MGRASLGLGASVCAVLQPFRLRPQPAPLPSKRPGPEGLWVLNPKSAGFLPAPTWGTSRVKRTDTRARDCPPGHLRPPYRPSRGGHPGGWVPSTAPRRRQKQDMAASTQRDRAQKGSVEGERQEGESARFRERKAGNTQRPVSRASAPSPSSPAKRPLRATPWDLCTPTHMANVEKLPMPRARGCRPPEASHGRRGHAHGQTPLGTLVGPPERRPLSPVTKPVCSQVRTCRNAHIRPPNPCTIRGTPHLETTERPSAAGRGNADGQTQTRSSVAASHRPAWIKRSQRPELVLGFHVNKCQRRARLAQQVQCESSG